MDIKIDSDKPFPKRSKWQFLDNMKHGDSALIVAESQDELVGARMRAKSQGFKVVVKRENKCHYRIWKKEH